MIRRFVRVALGGLLGAGLVFGGSQIVQPRAAEAYTSVPWSFHMNTNSQMTYYAVRNQIGSVAEPAIGAYVDTYNAWLAYNGSKVRLYYVYGGTAACSTGPAAYEILFCGTQNQSWSGQTETFSSSFNEYDGGHYSKSRIWIDAYDLRDGTSTFAYHLIGHELGHAFNLQHSSNPNSLMYNGGTSLHLDSYDHSVLKDKTAHTHCPCVIA